jgi:hypothetical protein
MFWLGVPLTVWAANDDFCGAGVHQHTSACRCQASSSLCFCHEPGELPSLGTALRETLPVLLPALWVDLPAPQRAPWTLTPTANPLAPDNWITRPACRPPRG